MMAMLQVYIYTALTIQSFWLCHCLEPMFVTKFCLNLKIIRNKLCLIKKQINFVLKKKNKL